MAGYIIFPNVVGLGILFGLVVPKHLHLGGDHPVFNVGVGVLAYTFGLRHAFDADHIAAVDNTTRKLLADNAENGTTRKPRRSASPILFAAGMCLMDPIDGVFMNAASGWVLRSRCARCSTTSPSRRSRSPSPWLSTPSSSSACSPTRANITTGPLAAIADVPLDYAGYGIVGLFFLAWITALLVWRFGRIEEKWWSVHLAESLAPLTTGASWHVVLEAPALWAATIGWGA